VHQDARYVRNRECLKGVKDGWYMPYPSFYLHKIDKNPT
jgi:hypothetical protein